jgi:hypothetical protein
MPPKVVLQTVAALVVLALVGLTAWRGAPDTAAEWIAPIAPSVAVAWAGLWAFDRYAWRWRGVRSLVARPVLDGTWHGELASDWVNPETRQRVEPDANVFLVVRQRYWSITVRMLTKESASASLRADLTKYEDGVHQLVYLYGNTPRQQFRHRSELHYGGAVLAAPRNHEDGIEGHYFTDRKTCGDMRFHARYPAHAETHSAALQLLSPERAVDVALPHGDVEPVA